MVLRSITPRARRISTQLLRHAMTLVEMLVVLAIIGTLISLLLPAVQKVRAAADKTKCANNLHQIGLALHHYHDARGHLPPGVGTEKANDPNPWLTWQARLLPYIEQEPLWLQTQAAYDLDTSPFDNPPHVGLATVMPVYACPSDARAWTPQITHLGQVVALTSYLGVLGTTVNKNDGVLFIDSRVRLSDISDGTSQTLMVGERPASADCWFGWWYAGFGQGMTGSLDSALGVREINLPNDVYTANCPPGPYHFQPGRLDEQSDTFHFWSLHPGGAHFLFADASVHFLTYDADPILPALATRTGGESVSVLDE